MLTNARAAGLIGPSDRQANTNRPRSAGVSATRCRSPRDCTIDRGRIATPNPRAARSANACGVLASNATCASTPIAGEPTTSPTGLWQALVPDNPASDDVNRSDFVPFPVRLAGRPGATRTVLEFGYDPDLQWRCSQRAEACVVDSTTYDTAAPYKFATTDAVAGADCSNGCTLTIPAIADRILYYRWKYRDANGNVLATGPVRIAAITP